MQITITTVEVNNRRANNPVTVNGFRVDLSDAPALTGSEKQVAWAEDIRTQMLVDMVGNQFKREFPNGLAPVDELDSWLDKANAAIQQEVAPKLDDKISAKTWIDNRNNGIRAVLIADQDR